MEARVVPGPEVVFEARKRLEGVVHCTEKEGVVRAQRPTSAVGPRIRKGGNRYSMVPYRKPQKASIVGG